MAIALFFGDEIETIETIEPVSGKRIASLDYAAIFPANLYVAPKDRLKGIIRMIEDELHEHEKFFTAEGRYIEAKRIKERVNFDLEMIRELGYCSGIENYSRFLMAEKWARVRFVCSITFPTTTL